MQGKTEILGLYLSRNEVAHHWLSVLTELNTRRGDTLIACVDGLTGFPEAIASLPPNTETQLCIIHQIRNLLKYVVSKNQKAFVHNLKSVYRATTKRGSRVSIR